MKKQSAVLALGGGGSRGVAHLGVIKTLLENDVTITGVTGTSIGSMVSAIYALGTSIEEMIEIFSKVDQSKLFGFPFSDGPSLLGYKGIKDFLKLTIGDKTFSQTKIPLTVVTTDLRTNSVVQISEGKIFDAILSSIAIPGIFPPILQEQKIYVDGGLMDPVPVRAARALNLPGKIIAVTLTSPKTQVELQKIQAKDNPVVKRLRHNQLSLTFNIIMESVAVTSAQLSELRMEIDRPDIIIRPDVANIGMLDHVNINELIQLGIDATNLQIDEILRPIGFFEKFGLKGRA